MTDQHPGHDGVIGELIEDALRAKIERCMRLLAIIEPNVDDWEFPLGTREDIAALLDQHYGKGVRPDE
jgi:hypothetical protein